MKFIFKQLFLILFLFFVFKGFGQDNLVPNPGFEVDLAGWSYSGDATLSRDTTHALTPGSAKLEVHSVDGDIRHASFKSSQIGLPDSVKGTLLYFTFYIKAFQGAEARVRLWVKDDEGNSLVNKSNYYHLDSTFQKFSFPIRTKSNSVSYSFNVDVGKAVGAYYFDDFLIVSSPTDLDKIRQFDDDWAPRFFKRPDSVKTVLLGSGTDQGTMFLFPDSVLAKVFYTQFGVNSNMRSGDGLVNRSHMYEQMGAFRFPAGSGSNQYFWDCNIPDSFAIPFTAYCGYKSKFLDPDHFLTFKKNAKGEPPIVVNYFYARYGVTPEGTREARVQQAANYAASWVHYFNVEKNAGVKYWEIGNECYGSWETGYNVNGSIVTGKEYGEDLCVFSQAMKQVDNTIKIGAVLSQNDYQWNNEVLEQAGDAADYLIVHHYSNVSNFSSSVSAIDAMMSDMQELQAAAKNHTDKPEGFYPVAFTEFNIQGKPTTSMMNGLFVADVLGSMVRNKFFMTTIWVNEWNVSDFDSHGIIAKNDPYQANYTARPSYTPYYYYGKCFGDLMIASQITGVDSVRGYASTFASGEMGVVLINYASASREMDFKFSDTTTIDSLFWYSVYSDSLKDGYTKFFVNGLTSSTQGGGPVKLDTVFAYGASYDKQKVVQLLPYSVTYLVLTKKYQSPASGSWKGDFSSDWSTAYNWTDGRVPDTSTTVTVDSLASKYFPSTIKNPPARCKNLIIKKGAKVTIPEGATIIIKNNLKLEND